MARLCPHCNLPMCEEEARAAACPGWAGPLAFETPGVPAPPPPAPPPARSRLWPVCGGLAICGLIVFLIVFNLPSEAQEEEPEESRRAAQEQPPVSDKLPP